MEVGFRMIWWMAYRRARNYSATNIRAGSQEPWTE